MEDIEYSELTLLENLDNDQLVAALEIEVCVFADDLARGVLGYDLVSAYVVNKTSLEVWLLA